MGIEEKNDLSSGGLGSDTARPDESFPVLVANQSHFAFESLDVFLQGLFERLYKIKSVPLNFQGY